MREFEVWMEGYSATGQSSPHRFIGKVKAKTFKEACYIALKNYFHCDEEEFKRLYDPKNNSFWGCKCFDNEKDAMFFD